MRIIVITTIVALALYSTGCQPVTSPSSTQPIAPITASARLDALQTDLTDFETGINIAHTLGAWKNADEWAQIQTYEGYAQKGIDDARKVVLAVDEAKAGDPKAIEDALSAAAAVVVDFKTKAK